jgi:hypothetical protein
MADRVAEKMSQASGNMSAEKPQKGDHYRCSKCGMEIAVDAPCQCQDDEHVHFQCCGQELAKV